MKRILIFFIILSTIDCTSQQIDFGIKGGANLSTFLANLSGSGIIQNDLKPKISYHFGLTVDFRKRENLSFDNLFAGKRQHIRQHLFL